MLYNFAVMERETPKLRIGETRDKPFGGTPGDSAFCQVLYCTMLDSGIDTQSELARRLGLKQPMVGSWILGKRIPNEENFNKLVSVLGLVEEKEVAIRKLWEEEKKKKVLSQLFGLAREPKRPLGKWLRDFRLSRGLTAEELLQSYSLSGSQRQDPGLDVLSQLLQTLPLALSLTDEETARLCEAVAQTIQLRVGEGRRYAEGVNSAKIIAEQAKLNCVTYNGAQAGRKLMLSRQRVGQLRVVHKMPYLLTDSDIEFLKNRPTLKRRVKE